MKKEISNPARIEITAGVCGGKARIAGTRIRVQDIAIWTEHFGYSPDEIVFHHPHIGLADVHAALSYYYEHRQIIDGEIAAGEAWAEELRAKAPSKLMTKLAGTHASPVSS